MIWKFPFDIKKIKNVLILTEGGQGIGYGHITRNIGLIHYLKEFGLDINFFVRGENLNEVFFEGENFISVDWLSEIENIKIYDNTLVFIDSYFAGLEIYRIIFNKTKTLVIYDDYKRLDYEAGYILNPVADENFYSDKLSVLSGEEFIFLRKAFWNAMIKKRDGRVKNILITLGGNPEKKLLFSVANEIKQRFSDVNIKVVSDFIDEVGVEFTGFCDSMKMVELMNWADVAISAGGQTLHELYKMNVPTFMLKTAENQEYNMRFYEKRGFKRLKNIEIIYNYEFL